jgi:hypothetical protein
MTTTSEPERFEPMLHLDPVHRRRRRRDLAVTVVPVAVRRSGDEEQPGDHPGSERAEEHIETERLGHPDQEHAQHDADPHAELTARQQVRLTTSMIRGRAERVATKPVATVIAPKITRATAVRRDDGDEHQGAQFGGVHPTGTVRNGAG